MHIFICIKKSVLLCPLSNHASVHKRRQVLILMTNAVSKEKSQCTEQCNTWYRMLYRVAESCK